MSKFRIKMKLTGLELEIEGTREEMPQISRNIGQQFAGLLQPSAGIIEGQVNGDARGPAAAAPILVSVGDGGGTQRRRSARKRRTAPSAAAATATAAVDLIVEFTHDAARFGQPKQDWSTSQKAIWLLYVVGEQAGRHELTAHQIEATFNKHFRLAKQIMVQNIARDLGKLRAKGKDAPVAEDTTMDPSPWYLTEAGRREAQGLMAQALERGDGSAGGDGTSGT